jgi:hypothetical protein
VNNACLTHKKYVDDTITSNISNVLVTNRANIMTNSYFIYYNSEVNDNKLISRADASS